MSISRTGFNVMKIKTFIQSALLICAIASVSLQLSSQVLLSPLPPPERNILGGETNILAQPWRDLRELLFTGRKINSFRTNGKICLVRFTPIPPLKDPEEFSAREWTNVSVMLKSLGYLQRTRATPQIRVVQENSIVQCDFSGDSNYEKWFLDWPLYAGDVIIIAQRPYYDRDVPP